MDLYWLLSMVIEEPKFSTPGLHLGFRVYMNPKFWGL